MYASLHGYYYLTFIFVFLSFIAFSIIFFGFKSELTKGLFACLLFLCIPAMIYTLYLQSEISKPLLNPSFANPLAGGGYYPIKMIGRYPIVNPFKGLWNGFFQQVAFVSVPFILFNKKKPSSIYLFSSPMVSVLLLLNPILLYFLSKFDPSFSAIYRIREDIPYCWLFSVFVYNLLNLIKSKLGNTLYKGTIIAIFAILLFYVVKSINYLKNINWTTQNTFKFYSNQSEFISYVNKYIAPGSTVLMDKQNMWYWPVLFPHFMVTHPNLSLLPPNFNPNEREEGLEKFLNNPLDNKSIAFLDKFQVDYVLLDRKYLTNKDFTKYQNKFLKVFELQDLVAYKYIK